MWSTTFAAFPRPSSGDVAHPLQAPLRSTCPNLTSRSRSQLVLDTSSDYVRPT